MNTTPASSEPCRWSKRAPTVRCHKTTESARHPTVAPSGCQSASEALGAVAMDLHRRQYPTAMTGLNGHAKVLRDNRRMPEVFRDLPGHLNELTDDVVRLAQAGKVGEVRALLGRLLSQTKPDHDAHEYAPGQPVLAFRGIVGELRVASSPDQAPMQITTSSADVAASLKDFNELADAINQSIRQNKKFLDESGKPTPAQELKADDLVREVGHIIATRMYGWIRVEESPSVRLD